MRITRVDFGEWRLPLPPDPTDPYKAKWLSVPWLGRNIKSVPFGYVVDTEREGWLNPVPKELELLELAKKHLKRFTYKEVAAWLSTQSGRMISESGLHRRVELDKRRRKAAELKRYYARRIQKYLEDLERYEKSCLGAKEGPSDEGGSSGTGEEEGGRGT